MSESSRATKKQQELFTFLKDFIDEHDYAPSYREIMTGLGYKSVSTVAAHVDGLVAKGYIRRGSEGVRTLEVVTNAARSSTSEEAIVQKIHKLIATTTDQSDVRALKRTLELLEL